MKRKLARKIRWIIMFAILLGSMIMSYLHITKGSSIPSVHAICPLGGLENFWAWISGHANLQKLFTGTMTLFFITIIFALIFGRAFCGNICPFGFLQELLGKITKHKIQIPKKIDRVMRFAKYFILAFITIMAWVFATIWISPYDPWVAFSHLWSFDELLKENLVGFIVLIVVMLLSVFVDRFFCKYLCPAGALYGIIGKKSVFHVKKRECVSCGSCSKACPMNIDVEKMTTVSSKECIACGACIAACQSKTNVLSFSIRNKEVKPILFVVLSVVVFASSIFVADQLGWMQLSVPSVESVMESGDYIKFADLRGSMTIEEGAAYVGMELTAFCNRMEIPVEVPKETLFKEISGYVPGYDFHAMKAK